VKLDVAVPQLRVNGWARPETATVFPEDPKPEPEIRVRPAVSVIETGPVRGFEVWIVTWLPFRSSIDVFTH
jgi:hypothetical protein